MILQRGQVISILKARDKTIGLIILSLLLGIILAWVLPLSVVAILEAILLLLLGIYLLMCR